MGKILNWIIDKWLAGFITASIFFMLKIYIDLPKESKEHFFSFNWLSEILNFPIPLYIIILIVVILIIITRIEKANLKKKLISSNSGLESFNTPESQFENYKSDFFGIRKNQWVWGYEWSPLKRQFSIINLAPSCKKCRISMDLHLSSWGDTATCHKCRLEGHGGHYSVEENVNDVQKEIIRRIENREYQIERYAAQ